MDNTSGSKMETCLLVHFMAVLKPALINLMKTLESSTGSDSSVVKRSPKPGPESTLPRFYRFSRFRVYIK